MSATVRQGKPHRSWAQRMLIAFNSFCIVVALLAAGALGWANAKTASVQRVSLGRSLSTEPASSSDPQNYLLVGTDSDAGLSGNDPAVQGRADVAGTRSDTMMILRIIPKEAKAILLAIPRDLYVPLYDTGGTRHGSEKLNSAMEYGGPDALIRTINENFHVPIHHYVEVNFAGFKGVVQAVGGVPVYFSNPVRDVEHTSQGDINHTGLDVQNTGCITLDPTQSLGYVRARYFEYKQNGRWIPDATADLGRASRQQLFIQQALKQAIAKGVRNPLTLNSMVDAALKSVTIDTRLSVGAILDLGQKFQSFDPADLEKVALPITDSYVGDESVEKLLPDQAESILSRFRNASAAPAGGLSPQGVHVQVLNGSGASNQATDVTNALTVAGFAGLPPGDSTLPGPQTVIRYRAGKEDAARLVARYLDADPTYEQSSLDSGTDVVVVTSTDFKSVLATPKPESAVSGPATTTTTTTSTTTTAPSVSGPQTVPGSPPGAGTTVTTLPGYTPTIPPGVKCG